MKDGFIYKWFVDADKHAQSAHNGNMDASCETCLTIVTELLNELDTSPQTLIDANHETLNNPHIDACMRVLAERGVGRNAKRSLKGGKGLPETPETRAAEAHSLAAHGNQNTIDPQCDECMRCALRIVESVGVDIDEFLGDCDVTGKSQVIAEGVRAYLRRTNGNTGEAFGHTSAWDL